MAENARVSWVECDRPWLVEPAVIHSLHLPLNLKDNRGCSFAVGLLALRRRHKTSAVGVQ